MYEQKGLIGIQLRPFLINSRYYSTLRTFYLLRLSSADLNSRFVSSSSLPIATPLLKKRMRFCFRGTFCHGKLTPVSFNNNSPYVSSVSLYSPGLLSTPVSRFLFVNESFCRGQGSQGVRKMRLYRIKALEV